MDIPRAEDCLEGVVADMADIQRNLLLMGGTGTGATPKQVNLANDMAETMQEVENNELKWLKESYA